MDTQVLEAICRIAKENSVWNLDLSRGDVHLKLRIDPSESPCAETVRGTTAPAGEDTPSKPSLFIKSDNVGMFMNHPSALEKAYAKVGDMVKKGQIVGIISSMGVNHTLKSSVSGKIATQKVKNKEPVEYGEVIFELEGGSDV